jgi:hypothetical protein
MGKKIMNAHLRKSQFPMRGPFLGGQKMKKNGPFLAFLFDFLQD